MSRLAGPLVLLLLTCPVVARAQPRLNGSTIGIHRASGPIRVDGDLSDEAWVTAARVERWYEVEPGDNTEPPIKSVAYLAYDDSFLYVGLDFRDPDPGAIRAPLGDHDAINGSSTDFGGLFIDALNTGRTAIEFFVTPSNVQYDAVDDDASGENASPDFFWDSAAKITSTGWTAEMRIPFSSLRYPHTDPQTWGIILFRNYPRNFRYQMMSARMPRGSACMVCHENLLTGLSGLPAGGHLVAAPYASTATTAEPVGNRLGSPLGSAVTQGRVGIDLKYNPSADDTIDATIKPDFSQIESDTAQISANERFALFYPEKRPFFLEGVDLLQTPIQAVYTRTITDPTWGARVTGKTSGMRYTALVANDAGGGSVIIPGAYGSSAAPQDFSSTVFVGRVKRDIGHSFVGALVADRELNGEPGYNRVAGPDFEWRPSGADVVNGQWLQSATRTPDRPALAAAWTGGSQQGRAAETSWTHSTRHFDSLARYTDITGGFRADTGFIPQVGYRDETGEVGWTVHPQDAISRARTFVHAQHQVDGNGRVITESVTPGVAMDTRFNGSVQVRYVDDHTRAGDLLIGRRQVGFSAQASPSRIVAFVAADATFGQDIDFDNNRPATGYTVSLRATLQPSTHLALDLVDNTRSLSVSSPAVTGHLFTEHVSRAKVTYTFTSRMFVRLIGQYVTTNRAIALYLFHTDPRSADFSGSALFAYKLNWQSVMFVGYGDDRELPSDARRLRPLDRQFFVKLSYAFQR